MIYKITTLRELFKKTKKATKETTDKILDTDLNDPFKIKPDPNPEKTLNELKKSSISAFNTILLIFGIGIGIALVYYLFGVFGLGYVLANLIIALIITGIFNTNFSKSLLWCIGLQFVAGVVYLWVINK